MALIVRNDEQIKVGTTPGLTAGSSFFIFDGTDGKPDYRQTEIVITEIGGRGILIKGVDYTWDIDLGRFDLLAVDDVFAVNTFFNVHFQPVAQPLDGDHYSLVNSSFFILDINLTNLGKAEPLDRLNGFISKYEPICLRGLLGDELYEQVLSESSDRMTKLIYGTSYVSGSGFTRTWDGLVHDSLSLIACYIYVYYQRSNALQTTGTGTKASKPEAGINASSRDKVIAAWSYFASESKHLVSFLWNYQQLGERVYPEFDSYQYQDSLNFAKQGGINYFDL